jgi:hypothetical protein
LTSEEATPALNDCLEALYEELGTLPPAVGTVTVKLDVTGETGKVTDLAFLANTLVARPSGAVDPEDVTQATLACIAQHLAAACFPTSPGHTAITIPLTFA